MSGVTVQVCTRLAEAFVQGLLSSLMPYASFEAYVRKHACPYATAREERERGKERERERGGRTVYLRTHTDLLKFYS